MSETIGDLRILAKQVRNASSQGENTAERVGHVMEGTLDLIEGASPDLSKYYTKQESDTLLLSKWTYDAARAASWDAASKDRHTHANKPALDLIVYDPVKNVWKFTGNAAFSGDVISYANLGDVDVPTIYEGLPIDNKTIKRDINGVLFAESTTGSSFDELSMWEALGTSISSKLIAQRYINLAGYATEGYVTEKIQGLGAVFNLKGTKLTPSDLPTTDNKIGDVWYVASESVGYIWITDEKGVLRWEKFGEPVDLSAYYTKNETNALLANKWTTDTVLISQWNDAYDLRHSHSNKAIIDGITNALINNWNSAAADSHKHANKPALDLIEYDSVKKLWKFTGNAAFSGDVITYANLGDVNIPEIYDGLPIDNVTIKRYANGQLYAAETTGSKFDKDAMWLALSTATTEQINKSHLADALSTYVLTTDSRLSDSRNAKDVYAWAKQPMKPTYSYDEIEGIPDLRNYVKSSTTVGLDMRWEFSNKELTHVWGSSGDSRLTQVFNGDQIRIFSKSLSNSDLRISHWEDAYNWGDHSMAGYLKASNYTPIDILEKLKMVDGTGSGLDSDYLNGERNGYLTANVLSYKYTSASSNNVNASNGTIVASVVNDFQRGGDGFAINMAFTSGQFQTQLYVDVDPTYIVGIRYRDYKSDWLPPRYFAFEDGNILSATKLQTPRSIWGQLFDGTGNIDGNFSTSGDIYSHGIIKTQAMQLKGQDLIINGRRALVGDPNRLYINYANDFVFTNIVGPLTVSGNIDVAGNSHFNQKVIVDRARYSDVASPSISLAIGDTDTGFDWAIDGVFKIKADAVEVAQISPDRLQVYKNLAVDGYSQAGRFFTGYDSGAAHSFSCTNWFRSKGETGWINETYGGGIYMADSSHVAVYGSKKFLISETSFDSFRTKGGIVAEGNTLQLGSVKLTYDFANRAIRFTMVDGSPCNIVSSGDMISYALAGTGIINEGYAFKDSLFVDYGKSTVVDNPKSLISLAIGDINTGLDRTSLNRIDLISNGASIGYWNESSFHLSKNFYADANSFFAGRAYFGDKLGIGTASPSQALSVVGNIIASGTITPSTSSSDIRLKTDVRDFIAEDIIRSLNPKSYKWNEKAKQRGESFRTNKDQFGLMYQDVKANPFVSEFAIDNAFGDGYGSVGYDRFAAILIKGEIELFNKVETIETKVGRLEKENEILKTKLKEMEESHGSI